jgi:hypothetical protein
VLIVIALASLGELVCLYHLDQDLQGQHRVLHHGTGCNRLSDHPLTKDTVCAGRVRLREAFLTRASRPRRPCLRF